VPPERPIERRLDRFVSEPVSVRGAVSVIATGIAVVVVAAAVAMRLLDRSEYPHLGRALWWAIQTVTTVGYGDVTPAHPSGRIVAVIVMLFGIGFLAILTAVIASSFVARAEGQRARLAEAVDERQDERMNARLDDLTARLERIEQMVSRPSA
jgi:voltage-gated potassium channel